MRPYEMLHRDARATADAFVKAVGKYREDLVVAAQGVCDRFDDPSIHKSIEIDLGLIAYHVHNTIYTRQFARASAGKLYGTGGKKIGKVHR
jgi:hypothetical protein